MATKIQQILEAAPNGSVLFGSWLSSQGLDARGQYAYMKSGWLELVHLVQKMVIMPVMFVQCNGR